ncbi:cytochrome ubiquinol oxidase subunit I [Propionimicrobium lymphophilum]|uniref:cytochrome ubiquinol oxidase subunit I n=1 Tax=Propionimicrobium lymphophilum TaxID=33012 RepID=UPI00288AC0AD|nr:cytochrome ubiquinol oxidase subunit I [Propionimicrobium lymphophilum]
MDAQVIARWQFGITTVYHFFFVPVTIGMTWLVAVLETMWVRTKNEEWLRLTKFFSKLFLINFAAGVVTGIVQEFQFGMNWSEYSRFVGDIFGAPLALEALIAFFLESTMIGVWIFGWDKLSPKVHNFIMYLVAAASSISAIWILAANSWMQNPVGATFNNGRAELTDFTALLTNPFFLGTFPHVLGASLMIAGGILLGISGWKMYKLAKAHKDGVELPAENGTWRKTAKIGAWVLLFASVLTALSGHVQAQVEAKYQPMKLAASEGLVETKTNAPFSIIGIYTQDRVDGTTKVKEVFSLDVPYVLSFLATNDPTAEVKGITDLTAQFKESGYYAADNTRNQLQEEYADALDTTAIDPVPNVMVNYYSFRLMMLGLVGSLISIWALVALRKNRPAPTNKLWAIAMPLTPFIPLIASSFGWILMEMGRQPWIVYGVLPTYTAVSPNVSAAAVLFSTILYTLVYGVIAVVVLKLFFRVIGKGLPEVKHPQRAQEDDETVYFAY